MATYILSCPPMVHHHHCLFTINLRCLFLLTLFWVRGFGCLLVILVTGGRCCPTAARLYLFWRTEKHQHTRSQGNNRLEEGRIWKMQFHGWQYCSTKNHQNSTWVWVKIVTILYYLHLSGLYFKLQTLFHFWLLWSLHTQRDSLGWYIFLDIVQIV